MSRTPASVAAPALRRRALACALVIAAAFGCGDDDLPLPTPPEGESAVARLEPAASTDTVRIPSGRRSADPFRVRALDGADRPVPGRRILFRVDPPEGGRLSQSEAITDSAGVAESYLLDSRPGPGAIVASVARDEVRLPFFVDRAPGALIFAETSGATGIHGLPHPDSVIRVRVLDTEGAPMPDRQVYFSASGRLRRFVDTTDVDGWAETVMGDSYLGVGDGYVFAFLLEWTELLVRDVRPVRAPAQRVVLVSVDGLRADAAFRDDLPTFAGLRAEGASGVIRSVEPSLTVPAHLSMLSGVPPTDHRVFSEQLQFTAEMNTLDPAFRETAKAGGKTRAFMAEEGPLAEFEQLLACRLAFGFESLETVPGGAAAIVEAALPAVADTAVTAVFLHLPDPDVAGHAEGFGSPAYARAVEDVDRALARVRDALPEGTMLIVTSDHGGGGAYGPFQHGSTAPEDVEVPLFIHGPEVVASRTLSPGFTLLDIAPSIVWAIGRIPPLQYDGRPVLDAFRR